ncbi:glycosyltransferase [uncultured Cloacibacillus sp.]|uniref:glycosyltransferase n=1 Tax=uncultured Cloacibacillus sp. TaxID=889794 RepID=UPI003208446F
MKIAFLAPLSSIHTIRWANVFAEHGHEVHVISMHNLSVDQLHQGVCAHMLPLKAPLGYYLNVWAIKSILKRIKPDVLNAHYASGYGTLARLSGYHPLVLSVWGSDVYDFPYESHIKMSIIQKNLDAADIICSTSEVMKKQTESLLRSSKKIFVTPFGIDTTKFTPKKNFAEEVHVIGTVKTLAPQYGINTLIKAFAIVANKLVDKSLKLVIAGDGLQGTELVNLAASLGIADKCEFLGKIPHNKVPEVLHSFDIYVALSENESFGVAILEASACGLPVIVSDAGGLPEVVENGVTGIVVPKHDPKAAAEAILQLIRCDKKRKIYGQNGIQRVKSLYHWENCYCIMHEVFKKVS